MNTTPCFKCESCGKYIPAADETPYLTLSAFTLNDYNSNRRWEAKSWYNRLVTELQNRTCIFCNRDCLVAWIDKQLTAK